MSHYDCNECAGQVDNHTDDCPEVERDKQRAKAQEELRAQRIAQGHKIMVKTLDNVTINNQSAVNISVPMHGYDDVQFSIPRSRAVELLARLQECLC